MVYLILNEEQALCKIGFTAGDPKHRLGQLRTSSAHELMIYAVIEGTEKDEKALHARFKHLHVRREWFRLSNEITGYFDRFNQPKTNKDVSVTITIGGNPHYMDGRQFYAYVYEQVISWQDDCAVRRGLEHTIDSCMSFIHDENSAGYINPVFKALNLVFESNPDLMNSIFRHDEVQHYTDPVGDPLFIAQAYQDGLLP